MRPSYIHLTAGLALGACLLASCKVGSDYRAPDSFTESTWTDSANGLFDDTQADTRWWASFNDVLLEKYIENAIRENRNLQAAESRVRRAFALRRESTSSFFPTARLQASHAREGTSGATNNAFSSGARQSQYDFGLGASWEIDLFGGVRRANEASAARLESEIEQARALRLSTLAEVARSYYEVRGTQKRIHITENNIHLQTKTFQLIQNRFNSGEATEFDLSRAKGQLQATQARLPNLEAQVRAGIYRLSLLQGQEPGLLWEEMRQTEALPAPPDQIPIGQSSELLKRRPDLRAAERDLAAASADVGAATADLFPRFTLLGAVGRRSASSADLGTSRSNRYSASQVIEWPIFQAGTLRARIDVQKAEAMEALALYEQTMLEALADAETALIRYLRERETNEILEQALQSRQRAVELARALFEAGEEDFLAVLDAERELITVEDEQALSQTQSVLDLITLYTALGGGWESFEP